ncbi:DUF1330 domain-containing protein [Roseivirga sp. E12]|uniref:DUF1330 domain-containing protein n=1 Tax=Roseivirga sp. E12 TaxID=2819237 RepID=UPI001ABCB808|nr:DUF1330 domain-containing protein [Roseivirga sp. E12]MBO3697919.1 DUF1330 domain-containing protein [Roseivirga sp. E12]
MESKSDKTTLVVTSTPNMTQQESLKAYVEGVMPLLIGLGGKIVKRSKIETTYLGNEPFTHLLIMDFPSRKALIEMFDGEDYAKLVSLRDTAFLKINIQFADDL